MIIEKNKNTNIQLTILVLTIILTSLYIQIARLGLSEIQYKSILIIGLVIIGASVSIRIRKNTNNLKDLNIIYILSFLIPLTLNLYIYLLILLISTIYLIVNIKKLYINKLVIAILIAIISSIFIITNQVSLFTGGNIFGIEYARLGWYSTSAYFHVSIAEIYNSKKILSSGIDGLLPINYHYLSHIWFASIASLYDISAIEAYMYGMQLILVPLLLYGLTTLSIEFNKENNIQFNALNILFVIAYFSLFKSVAFESESFIFSFMFIIITINAIRYINSKENSDWLIINTIIFLIILITYLSKISTGVVISLIFLINLLLKYKKNNIFFTALVLINITITSIILILNVNIGFEIFNKNLNEIIDIFKNIHHQDNTEIKRMPFYNFIFVYNQYESVRTLFVSIIALLIIKYKSELVDKDLKFITSSFIIIGIFLAATDLARDDSIYFSHISELISIAIISSYYVPKITNHLNNKLYPGKNIVAIIIFLSLSSIILIKIELGLVNIYNSIESFKNYAKTDTKYQINNKQYHSILNDWIFNREQSKLVGSAIDNSFISKLSNQLINFKLEYSNIAVHLTKSANDLILKNMNETIPPKKIRQYLPRNCSEIYLIQAISGIPTISSVYLDKNSICNKMIFTYRRFSLQEDTSIDKYKICQKAKISNLNKILVIDEFEHKLNYSLINCN